MIYDKVLAIDPKDVESLNNKGLVLQDLKRYDEALQYFDKVLAIEPSDVYALNGKASLLDDLERYDEALQYFEENPCYRSKRC